QAAQRRAGLVLRRYRILRDGREARRFTMSESEVVGARDMLRHTLAALAYRARKAVSDPPAGFSEFNVAPGSRTPGQILAHMCDLFDWALSMAQGAQRWHNSAP